MSNHRSKRLYRDPERGLIGGVFAGLSDFLGIRLCVMRLIGVLMFLCATLFTVISYIIAMLVLPVKAGSERACRGSRHERRERRQAKPNVRPGVSARFRDLEARLRSLETEITNREFDWDRRFNES